MAPMVEMPTTCITCGALIPHGKSRCPRHMYKSSSRWALYAEKYPEQAAYYKSAAWRERRARQLAEFPDCVVCGHPARHVDHVISVAAGGTLDGPLQSMCVSCHRKKTLVESHLGMKRAAVRRRQRG